MVWPPLAQRSTGVRRLDELVNDDQGWATAVTVYVIRLGSAVNLSIRNLARESSTGNYAEVLVLPQVTEHGLVQAYYWETALINGKVTWSVEGVMA